MHLTLIALLTALPVEACEKGNGEACNTVALAYHDGVGVMLDLSQAATYYRKACEAGYGPGCQNSGDLAVQLGGKDAQAVSQSAWAKAAAIYRAQCDAGGLEWCVNLGVLHEDQKLAAPDGPPLAAALYQKACDGGKVGGCVNLAQLYGQGSGVAQSLAKASALLERACALMPSLKAPASKLEAAGACTNLGRLVEEKNPKRAVALHRAACDAGSHLGCSNLGLLVFNGLGTNADMPAANALFRKACDGVVALACWNLALSLQAGTGIKKDPGAAEALRERACGMGLQRACAP